MSNNKQVYGDNIIYTPENTRTVLKADSVVDQIVDKFIDRSRVGKAKYNTDLDREDLTLTQWLDHAIEEHMDAILYLEKIKRIVSKL